MRHPTAVFFWGLVAALFLWASAAALVRHSGPWPAHQGMMGTGTLLAGPGAWGLWRGSAYIRSQTGAAPQSADVERAMQDWLALEGNSRLKLGPVTERDSNSFQADIVTRDGSLAQRFNIDRHNGRLTPVED